jgi:hypothetical protein
MKIFFRTPFKLLFPGYEVSPSLDAVPIAFDCRAKGFWELATGSKNCGGFPGRRDSPFLEKSLQHSKSQRLHLPSMEGQRAIWTRNNKH